jgi:DNA-binding LytR/AlgR family response regulator
MTNGPTALIADDEPLLRASLERLLTKAWPELEIVARASSGEEAMLQFELLRPSICFLDISMPGMSGLEAAAKIDRRAQIVFVTAYSEFAIDAFDQGAIDYLVKPIDGNRLADTVARLRERLAARADPPDLNAILSKLAERIQLAEHQEPLKRIRASIGSTVRLIPVHQVDFLRAEDKYTLVAWRDADGSMAEAIIRVPLKDLAAQLDQDQFAQVHRSVVVNLDAISHVVRGENDTATIHLRGRPELLPVSRGYVHRFRQM